MLRAMPPAIALSKSKLLSFAQCPRRVWLQTYSPELEEPSTERSTQLAAGERVGLIARELYGRGRGELVAFDRGLRAAIETTRALVAAGGSDPIFEATFDYDGVSVRIDVLDRSEREPAIVEVKSAARVKGHHLDDVAIQAWAMTRLGLAPRRVSIATVNPEFVYGGGGDYSGLLEETDVTSEARDRFDGVERAVAAARQTLDSLDEPDVPVGAQCDAPHACEFFTHCMGDLGERSVLGLGGKKERLFKLLHAGFRDLRDVPEAALDGDRERRIWEQTRRGEPHLDAELRRLVRSLPSPRYYLDFETLSSAVPVFAGTRPYEPVPFQWSCHVDAGQDLAQVEFLADGTEPPMRRFAESLIAALGQTGPIVVYSGYERRVIGELAARFPDLAAPLEALMARLVDLLPAVKQHYYHPAMAGSWSIKAVLPTVAPELDYAALGDVRDGLAAQTAFLETLEPTTTPERRAALRDALLAYCRHDTLALARLVEFFGRAP